MAGTDTAIFFSILIFLVAFGIFLPFVSEDFNNTSSDPADISGVAQDESTGLSVTDYDDVGFLSFIPSVLGSLIWSFGMIPLWVELLIFIPLRVLMFYLGVRLVRGV